MAIRYIVASRKRAGTSEERYIEGACGEFGYLPKQTIHDHIRGSIHTYYTKALGVNDALVRAMGSGEDRYIETTADKTKANNLVNLPDC